jgi:LmbE family N-acetylglucosaminyl deacetylase
VILFVSPHLDDIALSCGGYAHRLAHSGEQVLIATLCTADAPAGQPLSPAAQHEHWQWQLGEQPYQFRRQEDARMVAVLGAQPVHLGLLDAIYRHDDNGVPLYEGKQFMGGQVHPWDLAHQLPAVLKALQGVLDDYHPQRVFCPLTAGGHVDHIIARQAVEQLCDVRTLAYYEDYPYAQKDTTALAGLLRHDQNWRPMLIQLSEEEIETRIAAIHCYQSQLFAVFGDASTMPARVREYIASTGGERYWERM